MYSVLITGANRGIGLGLTNEFLNDDWSVYACCRNPLNANELQALDKKWHTKLNILPLDVTNEASISDLVKQLSNTPIDVLINNAGVFLDKRMNGLGHITAKTMQDTFMVNTIAPLLMTQALVPSLKLSKLKIVINISSTLGSIADNLQGGFYSYRASKAALNALTKNLTLELKKDGITVVSMHPGWVQTDMGGQNAEVSVDESVRSLFRLIKDFKINDSGKFISYTGEEIPW